MKTLKLFVTQVALKDFALAKNRTLIRELIDDTYALAKTDERGIQWSKKNYRGGYTSFNSMDDLHSQFASFEKLQKLIDVEVRKFSKMHCWDVDLEMTTCWTSLMPRGTQHGLHLHTNSAVSGTFYLSLPSKTSALKFEDPRLGLKMAAPPQKASSPMALKNYVSVEPQVGRLVLFESWLRHEVPPNPVAGNRISVSFNYQ